MNNTKINLRIYLNQFHLNLFEDESKISKFISNINNKKIRFNLHHENQMIL